MGRSACGADPAFSTAGIMPASFVLLDLLISFENDKYQRDSERTVLE
jgi:hypothetical protein